LNKTTQQKALACAISAAEAAGKLMRSNARSVKKINQETQHDIKLELDVRCQKLIEKTLRGSFPAIAILGEEGTSGDIDAEFRWVVDPIDGTVNFTYGIPHCCVSVALQRRLGNERNAPHPDLGYQTIVGVVYDPFCNELWTAIARERARMNGRAIQVSRRARLDEAIVSIGFAKNVSTLNIMLPVFTRLVPRVRKVRMMGAAALSLVYVASGRFDAYVENGVRLWDIAAGGLIIECAGGEFFRQPVAGEHAYRLIANNGVLRKQLEEL
jgi:myo-inositol-1(or 4)-monophosphatase